MFYSVIDFFGVCVWWGRGLPLECVYCVFIRNISMALFNAYVSNKDTCINII